MESFQTGFVTDVAVPFEQSAEVAGQCDFDFIELFMEGMFARNKIVDKKEKYRNILDKYDLSLIVHLPFSVDIGSPFDRIREASIAELNACFQTASELGAVKAVIHPTASAWDKAWNASTLRSNIVESILQLTKMAERYDIELCAENIFGTAFTIEDFDILLNQTDVSMTLDTGHARITGYTGDQLSSFVTQYSNRISHVHLNDSRYPEDEHLPFGVGTFDFQSLFETLDSCDWEGTLSLEVHTDNLDYIHMSKDQLDSALQLQ